MKTKDKPEIKEALDEAEMEAGNTMGYLQFAYYLGKALVLAVCEIADDVRQIVADMPSHDS